MQSAAGSAGRPPRIGTLQVVFKVVERCNINCSYCYYFNMGDASPMSRPVRVAPDTVARIAAWLAEGARDLAIPRVLISFHGGEPMLMRPEAMAAMCETFRAALEPAVATGFVIQTNGTIVSDAWLDVFAAYGVNVGVSVDGDRAAHDRFRRDHRGRPTYDRVARTMARMMEWAGDDPARRPSTISVLDWRNDYRAVYRSLRGLGVRTMSFLLPDRSHDQPFAPGETAARYGACLAELYDAWLEEDDPAIGVRQIREAVQHFQLGAAGGDRRFLPYQVIVMRSDGTVAVNDSFTPALDWYRAAPAQPIAGTSLRGFLGQPIFAEIEAAARRPAAACRSCMWLGMCRGGDLENRFSRAAGFDNPSVYCDGYQAYYGHVAGRLLAAGYPLATLKARIEAGLPADWEGAAA